jgi:hypothetical protein
MDNTPRANARLQRTIAAGILGVVSVEMVGGVRR